MSNFTFSDIVSSLRKNVMEVTFKKVNGEERVMPCTLLADYIPAFDDAKSNIEKHSVNETVVRAYAIDKQAWRSFKVENVISAKVVENV